MHTIYLPLVRFLEGTKRTPRGGASRYSFDLTQCCLWTMLCLVFVSSEAPLLALLSVPGEISFFYILLQLPFPNKLFYLLFQIPAVLRIMPMIFVKTVVFSFVTHVGRRLEGPGPFERRLVPYLGQDLIDGHH